MNFPKLSLKPVYEFCAPTNGYAEFIVLLSLSAIIGLAIAGKLTDAFAAALTSLGGLGVIHDNCTAWLARRLEKKDGDNNHN
jgi:hypothetical protein